MTDMKTNPGDCPPLATLTSAVFASNTPQVLESQTKTDLEASSTVQALPNEIIASIVDILRVDSQFKTLANVAQSSMTMYDLVIPKLYQRILFTKANQEMIAYGCAPPLGEEDHVRAEPSRKDMALSLIHYLDLKSLPSTDFAQNLSSVREVAFIGSDFLDEEKVVRPMAVSDIQEFLSLLAKISTPYTLHVRYYLTEDQEHHWKLHTSYARDGHGGYDPPAFESITHGFYNFPLIEPWLDALWVAYGLRSVVHFANHLVLGPHGRRGTPAEIASSVGSQALDAILLEASRTPPRLGRLYLCDIPGQVLTPGEIASAVDIRGDTWMTCCSRGSRVTGPMPEYWHEV